MCENCGINHDTNELEDQDALNAFVDRLIGAEEEVNDLYAMMESLFGAEVPEVEALSVSCIQERGLTPEFELTGEAFGKPWTVKVAEIPLDQIEEEERVHGKQWWALDGYWNGKLVRSTEGAPPEPVTAKEAAQAYAEYHFEYVIPA